MSGIAYEYWVIDFYSLLFIFFFFFFFFNWANLNMILKKKKQKTFYLVVEMSATFNSLLGFPEKEWTFTRNNSLVFISGW